MSPLENSRSHSITSTIRPRRRWIMVPVQDVALFLPPAETRADVGEVLDAVAVVGRQVGRLLPGGADPQGHDAQTLQVGRLAQDAAKRVALEALVQCAHWTSRGIARS